MHVLLIEDSAGDALLTRIQLDEAAPGQYRLTHVETLAEGLRRAAAHRFDVALLDLSLRDANGLDGLRALREHHPQLPVVVLTGERDEERAVEAVRQGAQDYLAKHQLQGGLLVRCIRYAIESKRAEDRLTLLAQYDPLTGLPNRALFRDRLTHAIARGQRAQSLVGLLYLDLDRFKGINDSLGHDLGDLLLKAVAGRLQNCVRDVDTVARMGGDEFTVVLESVANLEGVTMTAQRILNALTQPFTLDGHEVFVTASIGLTVYPYDEKDAHGLLKHADIAMYRAKAQGGNAYQGYNASMSTAVSEHLALENDMRRALARDEFLLHYQPQMDLRRHRVIGMEALIRWQHPERGLIAPARFIPIAEESGLINAIGHWVLHAACVETRQRQAHTHPDLRVAVNLSAHQFRQRHLVRGVADILRDTGLKPASLELELTEGSLMGDTEAALAALDELKAMGVKISIDDFGTGYSSLRYLKTFPIDTLTIDQSFVRDITTDPNDAAIATAIIAMAHSLGISVIAEGVETTAQLELLRQKRCNAIQGYLLSRPLASEHMARWLETERREVAPPVIVLPP